MMIAFGLILFVMAWLVVNIFGSPYRGVCNKADYLGGTMALLSALLFVAGLVKLSIRYLA